MKKIILITIMGMMIGIIGFALMMGMVAKTGEANNMEQNLVMSGGTSLSDVIKDGIQFKYNVYSSDGNVSDMRYGYKLNNITITTPINTQCEWDANKPLRHCYQDIELEYMRNTPIASLSQNTINFTGQIKNKQFKNFKFTMPSSLSKGNNYSVRIEFDYPTNTGEEWNFSLNALGYEWKIDPSISSCSSLTSIGVYTLTAPITNAVVGTSGSKKGCMNITTSNVWLDCQGWENWIDGTDTSNTYGVYSLGATGARFTNNSIFNCNLTDWYYGINYQYTMNSTLDNITSYSNTRDSIYFYISSNNSLSNINASLNTNFAIELTSSPNNNLTNIYVSNSYGGITMGSRNILINMTSSSHTTDGISSSSSVYNQIINSTMRSNKNNGLRLFSSSFNNITGCTIENNSVSGYAGIYLDSSSGAVQYNRIWNNIINNTPNGGRNWKTKGINYTNYFNTTKEAGINIYNITSVWICGNYWSDYISLDTDNDGLGNTIYNISGNMIDNCPLVNTTQAPPDITPPIVTILSPANTTYTNQNIPFNISLDEAGSTCLLELDKTANITMTKQSNNLNFNWTNLTDVGSHNARFYCNDTLNNMNLSGLNNVTFNVALVTDTCTYSSGTWNVNCADNCVISSPVNLNGNMLFITGNGLFTLDADISRYSEVFINGNCGVIQRNGVFKP